MTITSLISFGANLGDPPGTLAKAAELLDGTDDTRVETVSRGYHTKPVGGPAGQSDYLNAVVVVETELPIVELFRRIRHIETKLGRAPSTRWDARAIDLDLLLYGDAIHTSPDLVVPHSRLSFRRFVLEPAVEVAPDFSHPLIGCTLAQLLAHLDTHDNYVAMTGFSGEQVTELAKLVTDGIRMIPVFEARADEPGLSNADDIELLNGRSEALQVALVATPPDAYVVSDFWSEMPLPASRLKQFRTDRSTDFDTALQATTLHPKLLVIVHDTSAAHDEEAEFLQELQDYIVSSSPRPLLTVSYRDLGWAEAEVRAAIDAM